MQPLSKYNKKSSIYCVQSICLVSIHRVPPLKDKRGISIVNAFQKNIYSKLKLNKVWADKGGEFYNNLFKRFLKIDDSEMYSTYKEGKSVVAERFIRSWKTRFLSTWQLLQKNIYFDVLDDIVNKYNNTGHRTIKVKPIGVTSDSYAECNEDSNVTKPKVKTGNHVRISKYKNIFAKEYTQTWSEKVFVVSKIKNTVRWTYAISD